MNFVLELYVNDIKKGLVDGAATPEVLAQTPATAWIDGKNALGPVVGNFCMDLAVAKAQEVGVGLVVAKRKSATVKISPTNQ